MNDDGLRRWLEAADRPRRPDPAFAASLLDDLGHELGFGEATAIEAVTGVAVRPGTGIASGRSRTRPFRLLLIAALVITGSGGLIAAAGAIRDRLAPPPPMNLLAEIRRSGHVRIAIRPDHPQFMIGGQTATGFDSDVATEIARRLGLAPDVVIEDETTMVRAGSGRDWDIALPSVPIWTIDGTTFLTSAPYYRWPHLLVVPSASAAAGVTDVSAGPICAVAGDAGEAWLHGSYGGAAGSPVTDRILTRASDADCLAAIASGAAVAAITAHLSAADLQVRSDIRVIAGGPAPEARVVIVPTAGVAGADPTDLLHAVDGVLAAMRADGALTRLSQSRFGGADLTVP
jgi:ABC-type amino acid transport substrate-binding protein